MEGNSLLKGRDVQTRAGKKPRVLEKIFKFLGFLGFNVNNAEHRYNNDPRQVAYMKIICLLIHYLLQCAKFPNLKVIDG